MMRRQLDDIRARGEFVAALYASESLIYGRYGYGRASSELFFQIDTHKSAFVPGAPSDPVLCDELGTRLLDLAHDAVGPARLFRTPPCRAAGVTLVQLRLSLTDNHE